jgi:hypothetical protein
LRPESIKANHAASDKGVTFTEHSYRSQQHFFQTGIPPHYLG